MQRLNYIHINIYGDDGGKQSVAIKYTVIYDYAAAAEDELTVEQDEVVTMVSSPVNGWMKVRFFMVFFLSLIWLLLYC